MHSTSNLSSSSVHNASGIDVKAWTVEQPQPAAAALCATEVATLPFWALSEMPFTILTMAMLYSSRSTSSDAAAISLPGLVLSWSLQ